MQTKQLLTGAATIVGLLFIVAAVIYFITLPNNLPSFLPGYKEGVAPHTKHGILALALGICCFIAARFLWGPAKETPEV